MTDCGELKAGDRVRQDSAFNRNVPYLTQGTVLSTRREFLGPGEATVEWDNGHTAPVSGYHIRQVFPPPPALYKVTATDKTLDTLEAALQNVISLQVGDLTEARATLATVKGWRTA